MTTRKLVLGLFCCSVLALVMNSAATTLVAAEIERVEYRLTDWKSVHAKDASQAATYVRTFKSLFVECKQVSHGDHIDVSFRCPSWQTLTLKSHAEAHQWQGFLQKVGFETKHEH